MKITPTPKLYLGAAGVTVLFGAFLCYTKFTAIEDQQNKLKNLRSEVRNEKDVKKELEETQKKVSVLRSKLDHLEAGVPTFAYIPTMLKELEVVGTTNGIEVLGVRPTIAPAQNNKDKDAKKSAYEEQLINVKGRGTFGNVMRFVQSLNRFPKIVAVRMMNLLPKADPLKPLEPPKLDIEIELKAYAFKDNQPTTKVEKVDATAQNDTASETKPGGKA